MIVTTEIHVAGVSNSVIWVNLNQNTELATFFLQSLVPIENQHSVVEREAYATVTALKKNGANDSASDEWNVVSISILESVGNENRQQLVKLLIFSTKSFTNQNVTDSNIIVALPQGFPLSINLNRAFGRHPLDSHSMYTLLYPRGERQNSSSNSCGLTGQCSSPSRHSPKQLSPLRG